MRMLVRSKRFTLELAQDLMCVAVCLLVVTRIEGEPERHSTSLTGQDSVDSVIVARVEADQTATPWSQCRLATEQASNIVLLI